MLRVDAAEPWIVHVEFQASHDRSLPIRLQRYNILVQYRHGLPVQSIAVLLRKEADGPAVTGTLQHRLPDGRLYHEFRYDVVRAWEMPVDRILAGGLGTLPLAPLCGDAPADPAGLVRRIKDRLDRLARRTAADLWAATLILMGLRYSRTMIESFTEAMKKMIEESVTYQVFADRGRAEGRAEEARLILLRVGTKRFGPPGEATRAAIEAIGDRDRLEALIDRLFDVGTWDELLSGS